MLGRCLAPAATPGATSRPAPWSLIPDPRSLAASFVQLAIELDLAPVLARVDHRVLEAPSCRYVYLLIDGESMYFDRPAQISAVEQGKAPPRLGSRVLDEVDQLVGGVARAELGIAVSLGRLAHGASQPVIDRS